MARKQNTTDERRASEGKRRDGKTRSQYKQIKKSKHPTENL